MNAFFPSLSPSMHPAWHGYPHCEVAVTAPLMIGTACIADIEATVTVYRNPFGMMEVGEIEVDGWQHKALTKVPVKEDGRGWTCTLPGFIADAVLAEYDRAYTADAEEKLAEAERGWRE